MKGKISTGTKIILKNVDGLCNHPQEKRIEYLNKIVTIKDIWSEKHGLVEKTKLSDVSTFFIEEDDGWFEWTPDLICKII